MPGIYECGHPSDPVHRDHKSDLISEVWCWLSRCGGVGFQAGLGPGAEPSRGFRLLVRRGALLAAPAKGPPARSGCAREHREPLPREGGDAVTASCCGRGGRGGPGGRSPASPAGRDGAERGEGHPHPGMGRAGQRAAAPGASAVGRSDKGFQEREWQAAAQPSAGCGRAGAAGTGGEPTRQLPQGHGGRRRAAAAAPTERKGLSRAAGCLPQGGCGEGRRGRSRAHPRAGGGPSTAPTCRRAGGGSPARPRLPGPRRPSPPSRAKTPAAASRCVGPGLQLAGGQGNKQRHLGASSFPNAPSSLPARSSLVPAAFLSPSTPSTLFLLVSLFSYHFLVLSCLFFYFLLFLLPPSCSLLDHLI